jgi:hypothetical protein
MYLQALERNCHEDYSLLCHYRKVIICISAYAGHHTDLISVQNLLDILAIYGIPTVRTEMNLTLEFNFLKFIINLTLKYGCIYYETKL